MLSEQVKLFVYATRGRILKPLNYISLALSICILALFTYSIGFEESFKKSETIQIITNAILYGFSGVFLARLFFQINKMAFIKSNKWETIIFCIAILLSLLTLLFPTAFFKIIFSIFKLRATTHHNSLLIQSLLLIIALSELLKFSQSHFINRLKPSVLLIFSFVLLILVGTIFLMLPEMTVAKKSMPFVDALFTSTSATCVTGLIVVDTATYFTLKGQIVIMLLIQGGGIGIITFAVFLGLLVRSGMNLRNQLAIKEFVLADTLNAATQLLKKVVGFTLTIELLGAFVIFFLWGKSVPFHSIYEKIFFSIFHSISAFCNAGFSVFTDGLFNNQIKNLYLVHFVIATLIFLGSLGFPAIHDLTSIERLRDRMKYPWKKWTLNTRIVVYMSFALVIIGAVIFYLLEQHHSLEGKTVSAQIITALFQSITTRTAGFNTVNIGTLASPIILLFIFLMFVGASPASTGGGIKTTTFFVILTSVFSVIKGKKGLSISSYRVSEDLQKRAFSVLVFASLFILVSIFLLSITDQGKPVIQIIFEEVSAFCTVGLSMGITSSLSQAGKIIISISMLVGRVGILTFAFALSRMVESVNYSYPRANIMLE